MKNIKLFRLVLIFLLFFVGVRLVHAGNYPSFETLAATSITSNSAYLHGDFYSDSDDTYPLIWFQYGTDADFLDQKTDDSIEVKKDYINSKLISGLSPETKYYFRTVMEINSSLYYGRILSFVTLPQEENNTVDYMNYSDGNPNAALDEMLHAYDASLSQGYTGSASSDDDSSSVDDGSYSFFDFLQWFKKKDDNVNVQSNLVHSEEEIKKLEEERQERLESLSEQERYNNSAYEDDEFGEIVKYNTNYNRKMQNDTSQITIIVFIILLVIAATMLLRVFLLKKKRASYFRENILEGKRDSLIHHRYEIPLKRDLHDPRQNPNPEADINNDRFLKDNHGK